MNTMATHKVHFKIGDWTVITERFGDSKRVYLEHASGVQYNKDSVSQAIESAKKADTRDKENAALGV